jgi:MarR family transcriptional regulator, organic hydroperoxide resistance regulator
VTLSKSDNLADLAKTIERDIREIRERLRRPIEAEFSRGQLTGPQRSVMQAAFHSPGLSLKELSKRVGLSHSTVSSIVDRLVGRGLLVRAADDADRRLSRISVSNIVRNFMDKIAPGMVTGPLTSALERASETERRAIARGLKTLLKLLSAMPDSDPVIGRRY